MTAVGKLDDGWDVVQVYNPPDTKVQDTPQGGGVEGSVKNTNVVE